MNRLAPLIALAVMSCGQVQDADRRDHASLVDSSGVSVITNFTPRWSDGTGWRVDTVPIVDIGSETGLFSPVSAYRSSDSSIIVADGSQGSNKIMVFDKNGRHLASAGGEGDGPCEFRQLTWVAPLRPDSIIGFDYGAHRISILSSSGQCVRTTKLPTWRDETPRGTYGFAAGADPQLFADGKLLTYPTGSLRIPAVPGPAWYEHKILRVALDGASWDTVGTFRIAEQNWNGSEQTSRPFGAAAFRAVDGSHFLHGVSSTFEFRRYDQTGILKQIVRRDFTPQPVTSEDRDRYIDTRVNSTLHRSFEGGPEFAARLRKNLEAAQWPETRPAYRQMVVDAAGNVWIEHYRDYYLEEERYAAGKWSIFSRDGDWLGDVAVPARFRPDRIYEDALIGRWTDEDEAMRVRMYRLRKFANN